MPDAFVELYGMYVCTHRVRQLAVEPDPWVEGGGKVEVRAVATAQHRHFYGGSCERKMVCVRTRAVPVPKKIHNARKPGPERTRRGSCHAVVVRLAVPRVKVCCHTGSRRHPAVLHSTGTSLPLVHIVVARVPVSSSLTVGEQHPLPQPVKVADQSATVLVLPPPYRTLSYGSTAGETPSMSHASVGMYRICTSSMLFKIPLPGRHARPQVQWWDGTCNCKYSLLSLPLRHPRSCIPVRFVRLLGDEVRCPPITLLEVACIAPPCMDTILPHAVLPYLYGKPRQA